MIGDAASGVVPAPHSQLSPISAAHVTILYSSSCSMTFLVSFVIMFIYTRQTSSHWQGQMETMLVSELTLEFKPLHDRDND
jgi:hypothetical protein